MECSLPFLKIHHLVSPFMFSSLRTYKEYLQGKNKNAVLFNAFQHQKSNKRLSLQSPLKLLNLVRRKKVQFKARVRGQQPLMAKVSFVNPSFFPENRFMILWLIHHRFVSISCREGERSNKVEASQHTWAFCRTAALLQRNHRSVCWLLWS